MYDGVIGFSGGSDSISLTFHLLENFPDKKFCLVYCNHLNVSDPRNINKIKELASLFPYDFFIEDISFSLESKSLENNMRIARYEALTKYSNHIYVGHHMNDLQENFMMKMLSGAGIFGLSNMFKNERKFENYIIHRPLLQYSKEYLRNILKEKNISWIEDETNYDATYCRRNFFRNEVLPKFQTFNNWNASFLAMLNSLKESADLLEELAEEDFQKCSISENTLCLVQLRKLSEKRIKNLLIVKFLQDYSRKALDKFVKEIMLASFDKSCRMDTKTCILKQVYNTIVITTKDRTND